VVIGIFGLALTFVKASDVAPAPLQGPLIVSDNAKVDATIETGSLRATRLQKLSGEPVGPHALIEAQEAELPLSGLGANIEEDGGEVGRGAGES